MVVDIDKLTYEELIELNHKVVERLKFLEHMKAHASMMDFRIGEEVTFKPPNSERTSGIISKFNRKTVTIITKDGHSWKVYPGYLEKLNQQDSKNVISLHEGKHKRNA